MLIAECSCGVKEYFSRSGLLGVEIHSLRFVSKGKCQWVYVADIKLTREIGEKPPFDMELYK